MEALAEQIWQGIVAGEDGDTFPLDPRDPMPCTGFIVGGVRNSLVNPRTYDHVLTYLKSLPSPFVGFWRDNFTGDYHVDGCNWVVNRSLALGLAKRRGELAIYDVTGNQEILVEY